MNKKYDYHKLNEMYDNVLEAQSILIENKSYFTEKDYQSYLKVFHIELEGICAALELLNNESSKGIH